MAHFETLSECISFGPKRGWSSIFIRYGKFVFKLKFRYDDDDFNLDRPRRFAGNMLELYVRNTLGDFTLVANDTDIEDFNPSFDYNVKVMQSNVNSIKKWIEKVYGDIA